jgi:plastocyanin
MTRWLIWVAAAVFCGEWVEQSQAATINVTFGSNFFNPQDVTINQGDTVIWSNTGGSHTVTGDGANNPNGDVFCGNTFFGPGGRCTNTFNTPGFYRYRCLPHSTSFTSGMVGTVTVLPRVNTPAVLTDAVRLSNGQFQFRVNSTANTTNIVETSTNLTSWQPLVTNVTQSGTFSITDGAALNLRFYRVQKP